MSMKTSAIAIVMMSALVKGCLMPAHTEAGLCRAPRAGVGQATKEETAGGNVTFR